MTQNEKLELLRYLIFIRGKVQHLSIELLIMGQDSSQVDQVEQQLTQKINALRGQIMQDWQGDAGTVMNELKAINEKAQSKIRDLRAAVDKAQKVTEFVKILDQGLGLLTSLVSVV